MFDPHLLELIALPGPRTGRPPHQYGTKAELADVLGSEITDQSVINTCFDIARALGLSDAALGDDIIVRGLPGSDGKTVLVPMLTPDAFIRLAVRTGLYLPGKSWVDVDRADPDNNRSWTAHAVCRTRYDRDSGWVEVGAQAHFFEWFERGPDLRTPTREWAFNGKDLLREIANCLAAQLALTPLLDDIPCSCLVAGFANDLELGERIQAWDQAHQRSA